MSSVLDAVGGLRLQDWARMLTNAVGMARADLRRVEKAAARIRQSREELVAAVLAAVASGETYRDIAEAAGISHQRVGQIVKEAQRG